MISVVRFRLRVWKSLGFGPDPDPGKIKNLYKILAFLCQNQHYFLENRKLASYLDFFTFLFHFVLDPDPEPDPQCVPVPRRQKVTVPVVPVPQHCSRYRTPYGIPYYIYILYSVTICPEPGSIDH
jgi:hypothetical protein